MLLRHFGYFDNTYKMIIFESIQNDNSSIKMFTTLFKLLFSIHRNTKKSLQSTHKLNNIS